MYSSNNPVNYTSFPKLPSDPSKPTSALEEEESQSDEMNNTTKACGHDFKSSIFGDTFKPKPSNFGGFGQLSQTKPLTCWTAGDPPEPEPSTSRIRAFGDPIPYVPQKPYIEPSTSRIRAFGDPPEPEPSTSRIRLFGDPPKPEPSTSRIRAFGDPPKPVQSLVLFQDVDETLNDSEPKSLYEYWSEEVGPSSSMENDLEMIDYLLYYWKLNCKKLNGKKLSYLREVMITIDGILNEEIKLKKKKKKKKDRK